MVDGVAVLHTGEVTPSQRAWAAVLHAGKDAALTGDAALHLIGFPLDPPEVIDVAVPTKRRAVDAVLNDKTQVTVRRVSGLASLLDPGATLPGLTRHVAVLHAAAWAPSDGAAEWRIAAMAQRRLSAAPLMRAALEQLPRLPRRALLRAVLDDVELGAHAGTELAFLRFVRKHRLPQPDDLQLRVRTGGTTAYLDVRYTKQRVAIELDGAHHREAGTWDADALRSLRLVVAMPGEQVIRLTMANLRHDGPEVAKLLGQLLASRKVFPSRAR